jgi:lycopene cyclase domain-containing protein
MTYLQFVLLFLVAPSALLLALHGARHVRLLAIALAIAVVVAMAYTIPWAYVLVHNGVWRFDPAKTGSTLWRLPWETFVAIALQVVFTGTLTALALRRPWGRK